MALLESRQKIFYRQTGVIIDSYEGSTLTASSGESVFPVQYTSKVDGIGNKGLVCVTRVPAALPEPCFYCSLNGKLTCYCTREFCQESHYTPKLQGNNDGSMYSPGWVFPNNFTLRVSEVRARTALLTWSPLFGENESFWEAVKLTSNLEMEYEVQVNDTGIDGKYRTILIGASMECLLTDLLPHTWYFIKVYGGIKSQNACNRTSKTVSFFTKACEPNQPSPPELLHCSEMTFTLQWTPAVNNGSEILHYVLEMDLAVREDQGCFVPIYTGRDETFNVHELQSSTSYKFRVIAVNEVGQSRPSKTVIYTTQDRPFSHPILVKSALTKISEKPVELCQKNHPTSERIKFTCPTEVMVIDFISPIEMVVLQSTKANQLNEIVANTQNPDPSVVQPKISELYLAIYDGLWARACVQQISPDKSHVTVDLIDFGIVGLELKVTDLRQLQQFREVEGLAARIGLAGVGWKEENWDENSPDLLRDVIKVGQEVKFTVEGLGTLKGIEMVAMKDMNGNNVKEIWVAKMESNNIQKMGEELEIVLRLEDLSNPIATFEKNKIKEPCKIPESYRNILMKNLHKTNSCKIPKEHSSSSKATIIEREVTNDEKQKVHIQKKKKAKNVCATSPSIKISFDTERIIKKDNKYLNTNIFEVLSQEDSNIEINSRSCVERPQHKDKKGKQTDKGKKPKQTVVFRTQPRRQTKKKTPANRKRKSKDDPGDDDDYGSGDENDEDDDDDEDDEDDDADEEDDDVDGENKDDPLEPPPRKKPKLINTEIEILESVVKPNSPLHIKMNVKNLRNGTSKIVSMPYHFIEDNKARNFVINAVEYLIFMEGDVHNESKEFSRYLDVLIKKTHIGGGPSKEWKKFNRISLYQKEEGEGPVLLICGEQEVWELVHPPDFARKLSIQEVKNLDFSIEWTGPICNFIGDVKSCFENLLAVIDKMNQQQVPENYSFPVAAITAGMAGYLYPVLRDVYNGFPSTVTCSGLTHDTGKGLMTHMIMYMFHGKKALTSIKNTIASVMNVLSEGKHIFVDEYFKFKLALEFAVKAIWDHSGTEDRGKWKLPEGVLMVNCNHEKEDFESLGEALLSKINFIWTGSVPLAADNKLKLQDEMEANAKAIYKTVPILYGIALCVCGDKVTDEELKHLNDLLITPGDQRQGQLLVNYLRFTKLMKIVGDHFKLKMPEIFKLVDESNLESIDFGALVYFNPVDDVSPDQIIEWFFQHKQEAHLVVTRKRVYILSAEVKIRIPRNISKGLKELPTKSTTIRKYKNRFKYIEPDQLSEVNIRRLEDMSLECPMYDGQLHETILYEQEQENQMIEELRQTFLDGENQNTDANSDGDVLSVRFSPATAPFEFGVNSQQATKSTSREGSSESSCSKDTAGRLSGSKDKGENIIGDDDLNFRSGDNEAAIGESSSSKDTNNLLSGSKDKGENGIGDQSFASRYNESSIIGHSRLSLGSRDRSTSEDRTTSSDSRKDGTTSSDSRKDGTASSDSRKDGTRSSDSRKDGTTNSGSRNNDNPVNLTCNIIGCAANKKGKIYANKRTLQDHELTKSHISAVKELSKNEK